MFLQYFKLKISYLKYVFNNIQYAPYVEGATSLLFVKDGVTISKNVKEYVRYFFTLLFYGRNVKLNKKRLYLLNK